MTHQTDSNVLETVMELLSGAGFNGVAEAFRILVNESMKAERCAALGADLHQRSRERKGYANGTSQKPSPPASAKPPSASRSACGRR